MKRKITSYYLLVVIASSLLVSCSNDEEVTPVNSEISKEKEVEKVVLEKTSLKELGFNSMGELLATVKKEELGLKSTVVQETSTGKSSSSGFVICTSSGSNVGIKAVPIGDLGPRVLMTSAQVEKMQLGSNLIKSIYMYKGVKPDGVTINKWQSSGAYSKFNLADEYGWFTYIRSGVPTIKEIDREKEDDEEIFKFPVRNYSSVTDNAWRTFSYAKGISVNKIVTHTVGFSAGLSINVPFGGINLGMNYSYTTGTEINNSQMITHEQRYVATLPPRSQRMIYVVQRKVKRKFEYKFPAVIDGEVAVNFGKKVNGHYFWAFPASKLMFDQEIAELGSVTTNESYDIEIFGGPDEPITEPFPY